MSLYSLKHDGAGAVQPWSQVITLAGAGKGCDGLFGLYDSLGDTTLTGANTIATLLDGPEKVVRYGALTLGDGTAATTLTASSRCKGLTILCDSLTVKNNATLHMNLKGARVMTGDDPFFPFIDYKIPFKVALESSLMPLAQVLSVVRENGFAPWDMGTWQHLVSALYGFNLGITLNGSVSLMQATGGGDGANGAVNQNTAVAGNQGGAGVGGAMGGGGSGSLNTMTSAWQYGAKAGKGCPYSGGSGAGGFYYSNSNSVGACLLSLYSGPGGKGGWPNAYQTHEVTDISVRPPGWGAGGAGNPGGVFGASSAIAAPADNGCGGKLTVVCRGTITVQGGGKIEANGGNGGSCTNCGGGGSGGGHVSLISPAAVSNAGTIQAAGGQGGDTGSTKGGNGGAGSVVTKTFSDMGW